MVAQQRFLWRVWTRKRCVEVIEKTVSRSFPPSFPTFFIGNLGHGRSLGIRMSIGFTGCMTGHFPGNKMHWLLGQCEPSSIALAVGDDGEEPGEGRRVKGRKVKGWKEDGGRTRLVFSLAFHFSRLPSSWLPSSASIPEFLILI